MNYFNYFTEIEDTFIRRRGKNLFLSPLDWALIEVWQEREVPLHIVLRGIEKVFDVYDAKAKKTRTIKSLMYCREEIEAQYEEWLESQVGKSEATEIAESDESDIFSRDTIIAHLESVSEQLQSAKDNADSDLREVLERAIHRLGELRTTFTDAENLETDLTNLEKLIDEALLKNADETSKMEIVEQLKSYKKEMAADVYQRTFELMLLKKLRDFGGIPRSSLFYL